MNKKITVIRGNRLVGTIYAKPKRASSRTWRSATSTHGELPEMGKMADVRDKQILMASITGDVDFNLAGVHRDEIKN